MSTAARPAPSASRHTASPRARRLALDRGLRLDRLTGTGPWGRVVVADVLRAADRPPHEDSPRARRRARGQAGPSPVPPSPPRAVPTPSRPPTTDEVASLDRSGSRAHESLSLDVDVTGIAPTEVLPVIVAAAVAALWHDGPSAAGPPGVTVVVRRPGLPSDGPGVLRAAHELSATGVRAALAVTAEPPSTTEQETLLGVTDLAATGLDAGDLAPSGDETVALTVGAPRPAVVVLEADGGAGTAVRMLSRLTLAWDPARLEAADAVRVAAGLRARTRP